MGTTLHTEQLKAFFKDRQPFTVEDIRAFYQKLGDEINRSTLDWRIHQLRKLGILHKEGRGIYTFQPGQVFSPSIDRKLKLLHNKIKNEFPFLTTCVWDTKWLNELMVHQPVNFYTLIEVEKAGMEPVFYFLKEQEKNKTLLLAPTASMLEKYEDRNKDTFIVNPLISEAPLQKTNNVQIPTLEKILVDIFCDKTVLGAYQGKEMSRIFANAYEKYQVDEPKLMRYASRRSKKEAIRSFVHKIKEKAIH